MKIEPDVQTKRDVKLSSQPSAPLRGILKVRGRSNPPPPLPPKNEGKYGDSQNRPTSLPLQPPPPPSIKPSPPSTSASARPSNFIGPVIPEELRKKPVTIVGQPKISVPVKTSLLEAKSAQANPSRSVNESPVARPYGANNQTQQSPVVQQPSQPPMTPNPTEVMIAPQAYPMITNQYPANSTPQLQTVYYQLPNQHVPVPGR
jgi:hypothetical protein